MDLVIARLQREYIGRLPHPFPLIEKLDLLLAQPLNVEGAAGHEMLEMFHGLKRTRELAAAAGDRPLLSGCGLIAHHLGVQRAWTSCRKTVRPLAARLFLDDAEHLRNDIAGPLNTNGIADANA